MAATVYPVILSGGAGTRLWPLSRTLRPKQLLPLVTDKSMLQETVFRVSANGFGKPVIVCNQEHRFMIAEQMRQIQIEAEAIILEPMGRNTAPAATIAAMLLREKDPKALMLLLPSDHVIRDTEKFHAAVAIATLAADEGALVTFGIQPSAPETGYGYVQSGAAFNGLGGCFHIQRFVEKPDLETAKAFVSSGDYSWNSGMFVLPVAPYLEEVERLEPELYSQCSKALLKSTSDMDFLRLPTDVFEEMKSDSIDYAVMEKTDKGAIVPADMEWSDVGSWSALADISEKDANGNVEIGEVFTLDAKNCYFRANEKLIAAIGVEDLVVVATDDVVLVVPKDRAQDVKQLVTELEGAGRTEHYIHSQVFRPWGWYRGVHEGHRFQVKEISVDPGQKLSHQMHHHRAEHWIIVSGTARVTKGNESFLITEDESTYIPHNTVHCLENPGKIPLKMIEVQSGPYLGEDDIVRFQDNYGRVSN